MQIMRRAYTAAVRLTVSYPALHGLRQTIRHCRLCGRSLIRKPGHDIEQVVQQGMSIFSPLLTADKDTIDAYTVRIRDLYDRMGKAYDRACCMLRFQL